jgi:hypothetical protein
MVMPTYCYTSESGGKTIERSYSMGCAPSKVIVGGLVYWRDLRAEHQDQKSGDAWTNHWSLSMAAKTDAEAVEIAQKCAAAKVDLKFDDMLRIKVNSPGHQKRLAAAIFPGQNVRNLDTYY